MGRQQLPVVEGVASRELRERERRRGGRLFRRKLLGQRAPEGAVDLERGAGASANAIGGDDRVAVVKGDEVGERGLGLDFPRFVEAVGVDFARAYLLRHRAHHLGGAAAAEEELAAEAVAQGGKAVVEPPALRAADGESAGCVVVEDVERHDLARRARRNQRAVVGEAQVAAEPGDRGHGVSGIMKPSKRRTLPPMTRFCP